MELKNGKVRLARMSDAAEIARMSRALIEYGLPWTWQTSRVKSAVAHPHINCVVTTQHDCLVAFAIAGYEQYTAHINLLAVRPDAQRCGLGSQLIAWHETVAQTAGIRVISLEVRAANDSAIGFYTRLGYRETRVLKDYYSKREDAVRMVHHL